MSKKMTIQKIVDCLMMIVLLFLMTYELIGQGTHEWLGITMLILLVIHHLLNGAGFKYSTRILFTLPYSANFHQPGHTCHDAGFDVQRPNHLS